VQEFGLSQEAVEAARAGGDADFLTETQRALVRFVRRAAENPNQVNQEDIKALHDVGLDNSAIMEALSIASLSAWTNTLAMAMKLTEDLEDFGVRDKYF
jgi:alkylhydroperoxidase family enzyme